MKNLIKLYSIILILFVSGSLTAQIGINTKTIGSGNTVYIEGGNTSVTTDDVIVTNTGNIGLGVVPQNKLDIKGSMIYAKGDPEKDKILASDAQGFALWKYISFASKIGEWKLVNSAGNITFNANVTTQLKGVSSVLSGDELGLKAGDNSVIVPKGRYLMFITGDIAYYEYGRLSTNVGYEVYYGITLNGTASFLNLTVDTPITLYFMAISPGVKRTDGTYLYSQPPYAYPFSFNIRFLRLD